MITNYNEFFNEIASKSSSNIKKEMLRVYSKDELLKRIINLTLNPFILFNIKKIPKYTPNNGECRFNLSPALDELDKIITRELTGNAAIDHLKFYLELVGADDAKVIERIVKRKLGCGVSLAIVNEVWENFIPEYPVMLCEPFSEKLFNKLGFPLYVQLKADGMRFNAVVINGECKFYSRNGKIIDLKGFLEDDFINLAGHQDLVFDGELVDVKSEIVDRQTGNGTLNKAIKGTITEEEASTINAILWDVIPYEDLFNGECDIPYETRFDILEKMLEIHNSPKIGLIWTSVINENDRPNAINLVLGIFDQFILDDEEGVVCKDGSKGWSDKRVNHQLKFKSQKMCELKIVDVLEGKDNFSGMLGAFICQSSDGVIEVGVGSGLTPAQRIEFWGDDDGKNMIDIIISVQYNAKIKNKKGGHSLFLPIFKGIRLDKTEADHSSKIK